MATSTVGPGQAYTYLQDWEDWGDGSGSDQTASCYAGALRPTAVAVWGGYKPTIETAVGQRHDGTKAGTDGAYIAVANGQTGISNLTPNASISGIKIKCAGTGSVTFGIASYVGGPTGVLIDGCVITLTSATNCLGIAIGTDVPVNMAATVQNCIVYGSGGAASQYGIQCYASSSTGASTLTITNCSVSAITSNTTSGGIDFRRNGAANTLTVIAKNCISTGSGRCFSAFGSPTVTATYCLSSDATANTWGGAGHLINQTAADVFTNVASDLTLKAGSPAILAGTNPAVLATDALGNVRNAAGPDDMGALTTYILVTGGPFPYYILNSLGGGLRGGLSSC